MNESLICPGCHDESPRGQRFCGGCGAPLIDALELGDEIRTASVIFADIANFTSTSQGLTLEQIKRLTDLVFDQLYQVTLDHGGTVDKYIGDCVMVVFGAPIAFGDEATRAVRAALAMQRVVRSLTAALAEHGLPPVQLRIGIATGPVIAGPVGAGPQRRYTVMGQTVNQAAHLQQETGINTICVDRRTYVRTQDLFVNRVFDCPSGPAYHVLSERFGGGLMRSRELLGHEIPMVGRSLELVQLATAFAESVARRRTSAQLVIGEAGVGKTRLALELLAQLESQSSDVVRVIAAGRPYAVGTPYSLLTDALRRKLEIPANESQAATRQKVETVARGLVPEHETELLLSLFGVKDAAGQGNGASAPVAPRIAEMVTRLLARWLERRPVMIVLDDLQWADAASLSLIAELRKRLSDQPLYIVGLARPQLQVSPSSDSAVLEGFERLKLANLSAEHVTQLLQHALGSAAIPQRLIKLTTDASRGNPYHVEELLRMLESRGVLQRRVHGWFVADVPETLDLPPGIRALVQSRIDLLTADQRRLLRRAATVGRSFWADALARLVPDYSPKDLSVLLEQGFIVRRSNSRFRGTIEYFFLNDTARDVAYGTVPADQRASLHRQVAGWLADQQIEAAEDQALLGKHLELGGEPVAAAEALRRAGDGARQAGAFVPAHAYYSHALELASDESDVAFDLLGCRERVLNAMGRFSDQRGDADRMLELAIKLGDVRRQTEALLRVGRAHLNVGLHERAQAAFQQAHDLAQTKGDGESLARALRWLAMFHFHRGEQPKAIPRFEEALTVAETHGLDSLAAELAYELGVTMGTIGDYCRALSVSEKALKKFVLQNNLYQQAFCLSNIGCFHTYLGEYEEALEALSQAADIGHSVGAPLAEASAKANLGNAFRCIGKNERAIDLEQTAARIARAIGDTRLLADALVYEALAALGSDALDHANDAANQALKLARESQLHSSIAMSLAVLAQVQVRRDNPSRAHNHATESFEILQREGSIEGFEQYIRVVYAASCARTGRDEEAQKVIRAACDDLGDKAGRIGDGERRKRFVHHEQSNRDLLALADRFGVSVDACA